MKATLDIEVRMARPDDYVDRRVTAGRRYYATATWNGVSRSAFAASPEVAAARATQYVWGSVRLAS
jgi:hypothetical protein